MPNCGTQCWLCDLPIRFDTYSGCSHNCKYCFVQRKKELDVGFAETKDSLISFINKKRTSETNWCDWDIPLHWGGLSDPFQPCEREYKRSLEALKVFAKTKYPVIISTKGRICVEKPYIDLIHEANCVMQISMLCSKYDILEQGAPPFEERLDMVKTLAPICKRLIIRAQLYIHDIFEDMKINIPRFAQAGAYGVIFEGMKFVKKKPGLVKSGGDFVQRKDILEKDFSVLRELCHKNGLKFYSGENRLRAMGDSLTCCGIEDLDGFKPNKFNLNHLLNQDKQEPTSKMCEVGTAECFCSLNQTTEFRRATRSASFEKMMRYFYEEKKNYVNSVMIG